MTGVVGKSSALTWALHLSTLLLVLLWLLPTIGLFVSSFRTADQISVSGWWKSLFAAERAITLRTAAPETQQKIGDFYVIEGDIFAGEKTRGEISTWGISSKAVTAFTVGQKAELRGGGTMTVFADGRYRMQNNAPFEGRRGQRVFVTAKIPPAFTLDNYRTILISGKATDNMAQAFFNTLTVAIPATIIPILIAAFAAYALAWMEFPGRALLIAAVVALLVVPLQLALIPILKLHNTVGIGKGYVGVWLAPLRLWIAAGHLSAAQLYGRPAQRYYRERPH